MGVIRDLNGTLSKGGVDFGIFTVTIYACKCKGEVYPRTGHEGP
jgi:hypothetical protein